MGITTEFLYKIYPRPETLPCLALIFIENGEDLKRIEKAAQDPRYQISFHQSYVYRHINIRVWFLSMNIDWAVITIIRVGYSVSTLRAWFLVLLTLISGIFGLSKVQKVNSRHFNTTMNIFRGFLMSCQNFLVIAVKFGIFLQNKLFENTWN